MNGNYFRNTPYNSFMPYARQAARPGLLSFLTGGQSFANTAGLTGGKLSFGSILNGASKTLNFVNQAIPVYYQIKPMWNNAKTMFKVARAVNDSNTETVTINKTTKNEQSNKNNIENSNNPTFFI
ncbi:MAG TPA: hypothetical protein PLT65_02680 [Bacilli bacterium]|nr:hypothetical protein [Bacilli bacterium]